MTDNEIINALKWHLNDETHCSSCPYEEHSDTYFCVEMVIKDALDLINRQRAAIESNKAKIEISAECIARQDKEIERLKKLLAEADIAYNKCAKRFHKEAIKEFAERLKKEKQQSVKARFSFGGEYISNGVMCADIDNLVAEMAGDSLCL